MFTGTRYEIAAKHPDGRAFLVGYTQRKSRPGLLAAMRKRGADLVALLGIADTDQKMTFGTKPRIHAMCAGWTIEFTGRTQLDCRRDALPSLPSANA